MTLVCIICFYMQYYKFIQSSYATIKKLREANSLYNFVAQPVKIPKTTQNFYIELWAEKDKQKLKIEQWNFKCLKTLVQSQYEQNQDSQLDSVELEKKSFMSVLEQNLIKFNPKILIKSMEPKQLTLSIVTSEKDLKPFSESNVFFISVDEYEGNGFNCRVSLETLHTEMNRKKQQMNLQSDEQQFVVLIDSAYERQRKKSQNETCEKKQERNSLMKVNEEKVKSSPQTQKLIRQKQVEIETVSNIHQSYRSAVNLLVSRYSTKQIDVSQYERKIQLLNEAIQMIEELSFGNETKLSAFLRGLQ